MITIDKQIELEQAMLETGSNKFLEQQRELEQSGKGGETLAGSVVINRACQPVVDKIKEYCAQVNKGQAKKFAQVIELIESVKDKRQRTDYHRVAVAGIMSLVTEVFRENQTKIAAVARIGRAVEDEARWSQIHFEADRWLEWKKDMYKEEHKTYDNTRTGVIYSYNKMQDQGKFHQKLLTWTRQQKELVGLFLYEIIFEATGAFKEESSRRGLKTRSYITLTEESLQIIEEIKEYVSPDYCEYRPLKRVPMDWTTEDKGGYYSLGLPLIKNCRHKDLESLDLQRTMDFANNLQQTPWVVDEDMLDLQIKLSNAQQDLKDSKGAVIWFTSGLEEDPHRPLILDQKELKETNEYKDALRAYKINKKTTVENNLKRAAKFIIQNTSMRIAKQYTGDKFWFPHQFDFRSREYCIPGVLQPQGSDNIRSLLKFGNKKKMTDDGAWWRGVYIAGLYGYDDVALNDRVEWTLDNYTSIIEPVGRDPEANVELWVGADKPFQFVQACIGYVKMRDAWAEGKDYYCDLPTQVDGKCNGLQHFSLMMRDENVAPYVGLVDTETPGDIYVKVANEMKKLVDQDNTEQAKAWSEFGIPRKLAKTPTMTCVYGSGRMGYALQTESTLKGYSAENRPTGDVGKLSMAFAGYAEKALSTAIGGADQAMKFLQECASIYSLYMHSVDSAAPLVFTNPVGFPVAQLYCKTKARNVQIRLGTKRFQIKSMDDIKKVDRQKMINAIAPNFVHSVDASHMCRTVELCTEMGLKDFSMIHDSYGCHASDVDTLVSCLKQAAIDVHSEDLLGNFRQEIMSQLPPKWSEKIPPVPEKGNLDIESILESDFFFS